MAFGDNYNVLPMLELAGRPLMMDSAVEDLRVRFSNRCREVAEVLRTL